MEKARDADVLVVGAGIFGLSVAYACARRGLKVVVVERGAPGAGASGGLVGALAPFAPEPWTPKKAFQLGALAGAAAHWAAVTAAGGIDPGYARHGRLLPLADGAARERAEVMVRAAQERWPAPFGWRIVPAGHLPHWVDPKAAPAGCALETLTARIAPRRALEALAAALAALGGEIRAGCAVRGVEEHCLRLQTRSLRAQAVVVAAGLGTGALLAPLVDGATIGGVKGQAALLSVPGAEAWPVIAGDGLYWCRTGTARSPSARPPSGAGTARPRPMPGSTR